LSLQTLDELCFFDPVFVDPQENPWFSRELLFAVTG